MELLCNRNTGYSKFPIFSLISGKIWGWYLHYVKTASGSFRILSNSYFTNHAIIQPDILPDMKTTLIIVKFSKQTGSLLVECV